MHGSRRLAPFVVLAILAVLTAPTLAREDPPEGPVFDGKTVDEWAEILQDDDQTLIRALIEGGPRSHPVLRALLHLTERDVVIVALRVVSRCPETAASLVPDVVGALGHADFTVRLTAAGTLHAFPEHERTCPALIAALEDEHIRVRLVALAVLADLKVEAPRAAVILKEGLHASGREDRVLAARICCRIVEKARFATERLEEMMGSSDVASSIAASGALLALGHRVEPALGRIILGLWHPAVPVRRMVADTLRVLGESARPVADKVLEGLESGKPRVCLTSIEILLHTGLEPAIAVDALFAALAAEPGEALTRAESILDERAGYFSPDTLTEIASRVTHETAATRHSAIRVLADCRCPETVIAVLARAGLSDDVVVRAGALDILARSRAGMRSIAIQGLGADLPTALKSEARRTRGRYLLNKMAPAHALPVLLTMLRSEDVELRSHAVCALCLLCPDESGTVPALLPLLEDQSPEIRREAVLALQALDPRSETPIAGLPDLLQDVDEGVRAYAGAALAALTVPAAPVFGGRDYDAWVKILSSDDFETWYAPSRKLVVGGASALVLLRALRLHPDADVRSRAVDFLGDFKGAEEQVVAELAVALRDRSPWVRSAAVQSLVEFPSHPRTTALILRALDDPDVMPATEAAKYLAGAGVEPDRLLEVLAPVLHSRSPMGRFEAIEAAGSLGPRAAPLAPPIIRCFEENDDYTKIACALALGRIGVHLEAVLALGAEAVSGEEEERRDHGRQILAAIAERGRAAAASYVARLDEPDELARLAAIQVLLSVDLDSSRAVARLDESSRSPEAAVRRRVDEILEDWKHEPPVGYVSGLVALLESKDDDVRIETLGRIDDILGAPGFAPAVVRALSDPNPDVRKAAEKCLTGLPKEALQPLLEDLAKTGKGPGRVAARSWLRLFGRPAEARPEIDWRPLLKHEDMLERIKGIREILRAGKSTPEIIEALEHGLKDPEASVRYYAEKALKKLRGE